MFYPFLNIIKVQKDRTDGTQSSKQELVTTIGDRFIIESSTRNFPDIETTISVMDSYEKNQIIYFVLDQEYFNPEFINILNTEKIKFYRLYNHLIYKVKNEEFKGIELEDLNDKEPKEFISFVEVSKALVDTKDWQWVKYLGVFLLKSNYDKFMKTLERFSEDKFSSDELEINKNSYISRNEMVSYSKQIISSRD